MSFYMFLHFKSDIVPHLTPFSPILLLLFVSFSILNLLLSTHIFPPSPPCLSCSIFPGLWPFPISFLPPLPSPWYLSFLQCFVFIFYLFPFVFLLPPPLLQSLCVRGRCCGFRRPALCRRRSTRQGHGVRTRCSLGTVCTSCPGPPIAPTCCTSTPPGKTSNRTEPPPPTSEGAPHCPGWSNSICCCIDLLAFDVDMDGDSRTVPLWCQLAHSEAIL